MVYYHTAKAPYNLITLDAYKFDRNDSSHTYGCIELENPIEHVAVFAFNKEKEIIYGNPLNTSIFDITTTTEPTTAESTSELGT